MKTDEEVVLIQARMIHQRFRYLPFEDLVQDGWVGLMGAKKRFDPSNGAQFATFASYAVRGAILDGIRGARGRMRIKPGEVDDNPQMYQLIDYDLTQKHDFERDFVSRDFVVYHLKNLPPRERKVILMYYFRKLPCIKIAKMLGVNESRVSQIRKKAVGRMREAIGGNLKEEEMCECGHYKKDHPYRNHATRCRMRSWSGWSKYGDGAFGNWVPCECGRFRVCNS